MYTLISKFEFVVTLYLYIKIFGKVTLINGNNPYETELNWSCMYQIKQHKAYNLNAEIAAPRKGRRC